MDKIQTRIFKRMADALEEQISEITYMNRSKPKESISNELINVVRAVKELRNSLTEYSYYLQDKGDKNV